jgi:hypothetical protein
LFKFGCWASLASAALHLAGMWFGRGAPANDVERQLMQLAATYQFHLPGGAARSYADFMNGFSLAFAVFMVTMGAVGLSVAWRSRASADVTYAVSRVLALASTALLVISLVYFFIVPTMCMSLVTCCFAVASVRAPTAEAP